MERHLRLVTLSLAWLPAFLDLAREFQAHGWITLAQPEG